MFRFYFFFLDKKDKKIFDVMMSITRLYDVAGVGACKPVLLHPILMSVIFEYYKQIIEIQAEALKAQKGD